MSRYHTPEQKAARATYMREWRAKNRDKQREWWRNYDRPDKAERKGYHQDYYLRAIQQKGVDKQQQIRSNDNRRRNQITLAGRLPPDLCEVCGRPPPGDKPLHFDHSHAHGHFRGWLCTKCNTGLGMADDDPNILRRWIAYLERADNNTGSQLALPV